VSLVGGCTSSTQGRTVKAAGAAGLLVISAVRNNFPSGLKDNNLSGLSDFPMADIIVIANNKQFMSALQSSSPVMGSVTPDKNYLNDWGTWGPFVGIFTAFSVINIVLAVYKLSQFIRYYGVRLILSEIILSLEIFANITRIFYVLEPTCNGFGIFNIEWHTVAFTFSWPYAYISTFMIAFYWEEMLNKFSKKGGLSKEAYPSLRRMRIPAIVVSIVLIVFEHLFAALRALYVTNVSFTVYITAVLYLVLAVIVGCYFTITGVRIVRLLQRSVSKATKRSSLIQRMSYLLCVSGIGMLIHVLGNILVEALITTAKPTTLAVSFGLLFIGLDIASVTQIMSFATPGKKRGSQGSSDSRSTEVGTNKSSSGKDSGKESGKEEEPKDEETKQEFSEQPKKDEVNIEMQVTAPAAVDAKVEVAV